MCFPLYNLQAYLTYNGLKFQWSNNERKSLTLPNISIGVQPSWQMFKSPLNPNADEPVLILVTCYPDLPKTYAAFLIF